MWIVFLIWILIIAAVLCAMLLLARAESHRDSFSASIPDGSEYDARRAREAEERRGSARVVAPGMAIAPVSRLNHGSTAQNNDSEGSSVRLRPTNVSTSPRVVEVKSLFTGRNTANSVSPTEQQASANDIADEKNANKGSASLANLVSQTSEKDNKDNKKD